MDHARPCSLRLPVHSPVLFSSLLIFEVSVNCFRKICSSQLELQKKKTARMNPMDGVQKRPKIQRNDSVFPPRSIPPFPVLHS